MDLRRKTRSSTNSSSGPPSKLGIASSSHAIKKPNVQQKSRKPVVEKWCVSSTSPSSTKSVAKGVLKMKEKCIISETDPKVGEQVDVISNGKIDKGRVIKSCSVGYLIHYEGWSVMFDEWINNVKSSKDIFVPKVVSNGTSAKKSESDLTNGAKDIKIIQIEDDKEKGSSVKGITRNNNSPLPAAEAKSRPRGRPSKYQSQILQTPVSKVEAKSTMDDNVDNELGVRTRNQEKGGQGQTEQDQPQKTNRERRDSLSQMRTQGKREQEQETRVTDVPSSQLIRIQGDAPVPQQRGQEETKKQGTVPILQNRNQGKVPIPQRNQGKVPIPQERNQGKVPSPQIRNQGRVPIIPQIRNQGKILNPQTGNQEKKFVEAEVSNLVGNASMAKASNLVGNASMAQTTINIHEKQGLVPKYPGQHSPSLNTIGPAPDQPPLKMTGPHLRFPGQHVPSFKMTGPVADDKAPFETPKAMFKNDYTANTIPANSNGGFKTKENFWITNKNIGEKSIFKNVKSENLVSENKVGFASTSSVNGNSGRQSSFSCGQDQSKTSSATASSMPFGFNRMEQFEKLDSTDEDDDDDLTCAASSSCMAAFWYMSELVDHLSTAHGILEPGLFCKQQRENKLKKINKEKERQERENVEKDMREFKRTRQEESNSIVSYEKNKNGGVTINLISPMKPTIKTESLPFTKVVSAKKALSQYEQIRENNIKERQEMFIKLGIKESKEELTPARRKSRTANKKSTPTVKTPSEKRPVGFSMTNDLGSVRKSSRLKSKPEMNYSIMDPDTSDNESQSHSDNDDDVWVEEKVQTSRKKTSKSWILKDKQQETNNDDLKQEEEKVNKNASPKSVEIPEIPKNEDHLKNVNDLKDLIPSLPTKREITKGYDSSSDDGGFYCSIDGCMQSFWYENQLFEHMAYTHD